jgi:hypothetical protein
VPFVAHKQFYFVVSGLKIIGHGNPDSNLEITVYILNTHMYVYIYIYIYTYIHIYTVI